MATFEYLRLVKESSYGVPMANPVAGVDAIYIRLTEANSFTPSGNPVTVEIPYGGGENITAEVLSDVFNTAGRLQTRLYPSQAAFFGAWLTQRVNDARNAPWPTDEPPGDLTSVSAYHAVQSAEGTIRRRRYAGCKPSGWTIGAGRTDPLFTLSIDVTAQRPVGNAYDGSTDPDEAEFPAPADADYPTGPFQFSDSAGRLTIGGAIRTQYDNISIKCTHTLDTRPFESRFPQVSSFRGRSTTLSAALRLKATPDDRSAFEALLARSCLLSLVRGGVTLTVDMHGANKISKLDRDLPLNKVFMHNLDLRSVRDPAAGTDLTWTVAGT